MWGSIMPTDYDRIREDNIREYGQGTRHCPSADCTQIEPISFSRFFRMRRMRALLEYSSAFSTTGWKLLITGRLSMSGMSEGCAVSAKEPNRRSDANRKVRDRFQVGLRLHGYSGSPLRRRRFQDRELRAPLHGDLQASR